MRRRCVSILIPVYNERQTIERVLEAAREAPLPPGVDRQLVVVNDGSVDGTGTILSRLEAAGGFELVRLARNSGKGSAIRAGIPRCKGDWILIQDGDLEYDPSCYEALVRPLAEGRARVVYGSRFLGTIERMGWPYRLVNVLLRATTNALYGTRITDEATAYKAFDADLLRRMPLRCRRFEFCPEVTARVARAGIAIHEVPVRYLGRTTEQGKKIRWYDAAIAFWVLFRERLRPRRRADGILGSLAIEEGSRCSASTPCRSRSSPSASPSPRRSPSRMPPPPAPRRKRRRRAPT